MTDIDFTLNHQGKKVFTREFLIRRGYCCQCGCFNCPYRENQSSIDPNIPIELQLETKGEDDQSLFENDDE